MSNILKGSFKSKGRATELLQILLEASVTAYSPIRIVKKRPLKTRDFYVIQSERK